MCQVKIFKIEILKKRKWTFILLFLKDIDDLVENCEISNY
jgi:hypothetical protein